MAKQEVDKVEEIREATREANGMLKDLKAAVKDGQGFLDRMEEVLDRIDEHVAKELDSWIDPMVKDYLDKYRTSVDAAIEEATQAVFKRFDDLYDILMGKEQPGESIPDLLRKAVAKASPEEKAALFRAEEAVRASRLLTRPPGQKHPQLGDQP